MLECIFPGNSLELGSFSFYVYNTGTHSFFPPPHYFLSHPLLFYFFDITIHTALAFSQFKLYCNYHHYEKLLSPKDYIIAH